MGAAVLLLVSASFRPASAQQKDTVTVMLQWIPQCQFAGMIMAYWNGFYEEAGLEVELYYGTESYSCTDALSNGTADIITTMLVDALIVRDMGIPIVNILQTSETNSTMIISHTPVRQAKDLNGMRIVSGGGPADSSTLPCATPTTIPWMWNGSPSSPTYIPSPQGR